jgi:hypothetical protein
VQAPPECILGRSNVQDARGSRYAFCGLFVFGSGYLAPSAGDRSGWRASIAPAAYAGPNPQFNQPKNLGDPGANGAGDGMNLATGNKYQRETDYASLGHFSLVLKPADEILNRWLAENLPPSDVRGMPLAVSRFYNSMDPGVHKFGANRRGSYRRIADALGNTIAYTLDAAGNRIQTLVFDAGHTQTKTHSQVFDGFSRLYQDIGAASRRAGRLLLADLSP